MTQTHEVIEELISAHALRSLDESDRVDAETEILEHIAACASCRTFYVDLREVAGDLAIAAPPRMAPAALEGRILAAIRGQEPASSQRSGRIVSMRMGAVAAAFMLVVVGSLSAFAASVSSRLSREEMRAQALAGAVQVIGDPNGSKANLTGSRGVAGTMTLAFVPGRGSVLVGSGIETLPKGRIYELWLIKDGVPTAVGTFRPIGGVVVLDVPVDGSDFEQVAVTVEKRKVNKPTTDPVYSGFIA